MLIDCGLRSIEIRRLKPEDIKETIINVLGKENKKRFGSETATALDKVVASLTTNLVSPSHGHISIQ
ncbi:hypothetical protein P343_08770 [Sporolactobacillus laevolacticus DSM 442]|uniref:Uncharacterized protein n=1 Tax=Sporolactobacillus laevolacticus DSM 442 TaxID=1395513 RepID=V6IZL1_9BACL|nr:hypothetical protein P343_08770 [Sporolactobacillus laevolacticus DSM 442]